MRFKCAPGRGLSVLLIALLPIIAVAGDAPVYKAENQNVLRPSSSDAAATPPIDIRHLHDALEVLQTGNYFSLWIGKWTEAIDWTAAVMGTHLSASLSSLSRSLSYSIPGTIWMDAALLDNEIDKYFGQTTAYYFGEDYFAIRMQAFDDMLWVVLGWLESIQFITSHSKAHYPPHQGKTEDWWHGRQFIPPFAHRARVFYELAEKGWDWELCGGGLTWNPNLLPYKNAITNQLFISASVSMYLYFPGDSNCSPFLGHTYPNLNTLMMACSDDKTPRPAYDPTYLAAAINGYDWLANSNMTNAQGLYTDGFHISGYETNHSRTECDERNEMVYTYNQGVVLSGLRGLWEATGNISYLEDGHELVRNVIRASGWDDTDILLAGGGAFPRQRMPVQKHEDGWAGLGADGILAELCDPTAECSQNGQTFKGIYFHHLASFCTPLPLEAVAPGKTHAATAAEALLHQRSCAEYTPWVVHNAQAALSTRDEHGRFGMWWAVENGSRLFSPSSAQDRVAQPLPDGAVDYRNEPSSYKMQGMTFRTPQWQGDLNDRGRGRTVETQGGGVAVVRAMWEFSKRYPADDGV
ncbi:Six-hairpin glycosidase [Massarina eburnea CBS 473.64]|uniref:Six-hairpin glycosidase n=1 Tax=Massarina eburnea CBS 473.64 TaxID=1395130 RepID=A0A6A6RWG4_9PLEO|nr:Six-hairpin glycosidase [Massarina eburnea CBS 473.64]